MRIAVEFYLDRELTELKPWSNSAWYSLPSSSIIRAIKWEKHQLSWRIWTSSKWLIVYDSRWQCKIASNGSGLSNLFLFKSLIKMFRLQVPRYCAGQRWCPPPTWCFPRLSRAASLLRRLAQKLRTSMMKSEITSWCTVTPVTAKKPLGVQFTLATRTSILAGRIVWPNKLSQ